jgi:hypothetical protein
MANLKAFRQYDEHDVINLFSPSGADTPVPLNKGTVVALTGDGWLNGASADLDMIGSPGAAFTNTVAQRYGVKAHVAVCNDDNTPLGITLYDLKEVDENGEKLVFNPRKAAELQAVVSGQAVPIATRGVFLYNGVGGTPAAGGTAYVGDGGAIHATGTKAVGKFLGVKDADSNVLLKVEL